MSLVGCSEAATTPVCEPTLAEAATLVFCITAPDARFLVGLQGVLQAVFVDRAGATDLFGGGDLSDRRSGGSDGKEQSGV